LDEAQEVLQALAAVEEQELLEAQQLSLKQEEDAAVARALAATSEEDEGRVAETGGQEGIASFDRKKLRQPKLSTTDDSRSTSDSATPVKDAKTDPEAPQDASPPSEVRPAEKKSLDVFLKTHGFTDLNAKRRRMLQVSYPLHVAVEKRDAGIVKILLDSGAVPTVKNSWGQTPLDLAKNDPYIDQYTVILLRKAAAPIEIEAPPEGDVQKGPKKRLERKQSAINGGL
jgi:hypothetical protein